MRLRGDNSFHDSFHEVEVDIYSHPASSTLGGERGCALQVQIYAMPKQGTSELFTVHE